MLPGPDRLKEIATGAEGSLEKVPYAVLLSAIALERRNCLVVLTHADIEKRIFFAGGVPVECLSNLLHETFGRFLVGQGKLTEEKFGLAFAQANASGLRLGEVLVERGIFPREEISRFLYQNLARKLLDGFTWHEGTYQILPDPPPIADPPRINVAHLIVAGVARFAPQSSVDAAIGTLVGKRLALHPSPPFSLQQIRLNESQSLLAAALEKRPRIDELAVSVKLPFEEISRLLYALWLLGTVVTADQVPMAPPAPVPSAPLEQPAPAVPPKVGPSSSPAVGWTTRASSPSIPADVTEPRADAGRNQRAELRRAFDAERAKDAFDLLGVGDNANEDEIRYNFLAKARAWAPWQFEGDTSDVERASTLFLLAAAAYGELNNRTTRESLQRSRRVTGQAAGGRPASQFFAITTDVVDTERKHRKGTDLLAAGNYKQALPLLVAAADSDPQNGNWAAEATYCKFMAGGKGNATATLSALQSAIRIDEEAGLAYFYSGEVLRLSGDKALAEKFYRKAVKLMEDDKRPVEALRMLTRSSTR